MLALEVLTKHRDRLTALRPQSASMRALAQLVEDRRQLVDDRVRITNRLTSELKGYFPQVLEWFEDKSTTLFCDFVARWPNLTPARNARANTLRTFFRAHNVRNAELVERRMQAMRVALPLTDDLGVTLPKQRLVQALVAQLAPVLQAIADYDAEIARLCADLPDYRIFQSFPGAAAVYAPRLLAAFGEDRERYTDATQVQRYAGVAPVTESSGNAHWVHWRYKCPTFLRQTLVEWAAQTIPLSFWAGAFYQQQRAKGASHQTALRALAFKWTRILFRCWQDRTNYNESAYLKTLQKRGSTLLQSAANSTAQS